jgi:ATP-binding cassette, subfamily F, member 3
MSILSASHLAVAFGARDLFTNISLSIARGARIAVVGPNGIGKTTLLRILIGMDEPSQGSVHRAKGLRIGYLPQEADLSTDHSLWEECLSAFSGLIEQEKALARFEAEMSASTFTPELLDRYGNLQHSFEQGGGYVYELRIRQVLTGLGFSPEDFQRSLQQLSGGQRTRAVLAHILLENPDLLVLDEPTNHLDIAAVEWLESYLLNWEGAALIVSHDRYFLDKVADHIAEMRPTGIEMYRGSYTAYLQQRQERWELRQQVFETEKERLLKDLDYIKRNISGQNTLQAKGRLRRLSRQIEAVEQLGAEAVQQQQWLAISQQALISEHMMGVEEAERRIRALRAPSGRPPLFKINLRAGQRSGNIVLRTNNLVVGYPGEKLFSAVDLELHRLECAAIIGPNGAGKTTFLKTILGKFPPLEGELELGASLQIGYFAQAHEGLHPERTLVEEIETISPGMLLAEIRDYLARFLFTGDDVFRQVLTLSGGERGRLALAKLALSHTNLLLLDEPTNHLDIPSQEILQNVLQDYQGTILLVTHDRYLIDALGTQIWEIQPEQATLSVFQGNYSEYRNLQEQDREKQEVLPSPKPSVSRSRQAGRSSAEERKRRLRLTKVEEQIAELEVSLQDLASQLENPPKDPDKIQRLGEGYVQIQDEINALLDEWEQLHREQG